MAPPVRCARPRSGAVPWACQGRGGAGRGQVPAGRMPAHTGFESARVDASCAPAQPLPGGVWSALRGRSQAAALPALPRVLLTLCI